MGYAPFIANLTDSSQLLARLTNVQVKANSYLGVEAYELEELIMVSNARSDAFLDSFEDPDVRTAVDPAWPDRIALSMDLFNANLMCEHQRWKLQQHRALVGEFFSSAPQASVVV